MIRGLLRKELSGQLPFVMLAVLFAAVDYLDFLLNGYPDQSAIGAPTTDTGSAVLGVIFAFALGSGLVVRELDEGTIRFLDALPASRRRIYWAKIAAGAAALSVLPLLSAGKVLAGQALSRTSLDPGLHLDAIATSAALDWLQMIVTLALAVALSFLRPFAWAAFGACYWLWVAAESRVPLIRRLDVISLTDTTFRGETLVVPTELIGPQLALSAFCLILAQELFARAGEPPPARTRRRWKAALAGVLGVGLAFAVTIRAANQEPAESVVVPPADRLARAHTQRYIITYPVRLSERARAVLEGADQTFERTHELLGAEVTAPIVVDGTGSVAATLGAAHWMKIRIDLAAEEDHAQILSLLAHETAHVLLAKLAAGRLDDNHDATSFFHEGVATWVQHRLFDSPERLEETRLVAATAHRRNELRIEELVDLAALGRARDPDLVYTAGFVWTEALVDLYGQDAPMRAARSFARPERNTDLRGLELWREILQAEGMSLDEVAARFGERLEQDAEARAQVIDALPRLIGAIERKDDRVLVGTSSTAPEGWSVACRFRAKASTPRHRYRWCEQVRGSPGTFAIDPRALIGATFGYQLGLTTPSRRRTIWERWVEATVPR